MKINFKGLFEEIISEWYLLLILGIFFLLNIWIASNIFVLTVSFGFLIIAGLFELIMMKKFYSNKKKNLSKSFKSKVKDSFLWVHAIVIFLWKYNLTIYNKKKVGYVRNIFPYLIVGLYLVISALIFRFTQNFWILLIYLIPIITNIISFFTFDYFIYFPKKN